MVPKDNYLVDELCDTNSLFTKDPDDMSVDNFDEADDAENEYPQENNQYNNYY